MRLIGNILALKPIKVFSLALRETLCFLEKTFSHVMSYFISFMLFNFRNSLL